MVGVYEWGGLFVKWVSVYEKRNSKRDAPLFTKSVIRNKTRHCLRNAPFENKSATVYEMRHSKTNAPLFAKCVIRKDLRLVCEMRNSKRFAPRLRNASFEKRCATVYEKRHSKTNAPLFTKCAIRKQMRHCLRNA